MRALITSDPKFPPPQEAMLPLMDAFAGWRERYRSFMETFDFFVSDGGGCGIVNAPDDATLGQIIMEYPFGPFSDVRMELLLDGDTMLVKARAMVQEQTQAMS
jgi:hypothetical protein